MTAKFPSFNKLEYFITGVVPTLTLAFFVLAKGVDIMSIRAYAAAAAIGLAVTVVSAVATFVVRKVELHREVLLVTLLRTTLSIGTTVLVCLWVLV